jgi:dolichyl-diphosphooligosaccharide--protein glycosyltransferase
MRRTGYDYLALSGLVAAGLFLRLANFFTVFPGGGRVIFPGQDPYYHMRRIFLILEDYPSVPAFDGFMNFPFGANIIWPPLFDFSIASVCLACGLGPRDTRAVETLSASLVPLIGAGAILLVYFLGRRLFGRPEALLAAALLALSPSHVWYSRLGFVDHHAAATLLHLALLLSLLSASSKGRGRRALWVAASTLAISAGLLCWNGFLLYAALIGGGLLLAALAGERERAQVISGTLSAAYGGALLLLIPFTFTSVARTGDPFSSVTLSYLHLGVLLLMALAGGAMRVAHGRRYRSLPGWQRLAITALLLLLAIAFLFSQATALGGGLGWLLRSDPFMSRVNESLPMINIYREAGDDSFRFTLPMSITFFHLLFPVAWIVFIVRQWRRRRLDAAMLLFAMWAAALFLMACGQRRFMEAFAPALALLIGWSMVWLYRLLAVRTVAIGFLVLLTLFSLSPWYAGWSSGTNRSGAEYDAALHAALTAFEPESRSEGVMSPWQLGHKILYLTGLPVVSNNFGSHIGADSYHDWSAFFLAGEEDEAVRMLEDRKIRYVIVDYDMESIKAAMAALGLPEERFFSWRSQPDGRILTVAKPTFLRTMFYRLAVLEGEGATRPVEIPALRRFRPVRRSPGEGKGHIRIFELMEAGE